MKAERSPFPFGVLSVAALPAIAFAIHDFVLRASDNQHEATAGFFITCAGLLSVWGLCGFLASRRSSGVTAAAGTGALAGVISVAILWLAFALLNNLFLDRMSYEPDRIAAFRISGYSSLRAYVNFGVILSPFFVILAAMASVTAAIGGAVRKIGRHQIA